MDFELTISAPTTASPTPRRIAISRYFRNHTHGTVELCISAPGREACFEWWRALRMVGKLPSQQVRLVIRSKENIVLEDFPYVKRLRLQAEKKPDCRLSLLVKIPNL